MTRRHLITAGWLAMASAVLTIPWFILTVMLADRGGEGTRGGQGTLLVVGTFLLVYLLATVRRLLHERHGFRAADAAITLLIAINLVAAAVSLCALAVPQLESVLGIPGVILVAASGLAQIAFGGRFLRLPDDLGGLRKPYGYLNIVTGVCVATVVLLPFGMVASAVADVMLGTIFFQAAAKGGEPES